jgi:anti-sigma regulatory factor (Ser/Thr protein kinase)
MNAFEHSKNNGHVDVFFDDSLSDKKIKFIVEDYGYGFNHGTLNDGLPYNVYESSGRGINLVKALCENVVYNDIGNSVSVVINV